MSIVEILSAVSAFLVALVALDFFLGSRKIRRLVDADPGNSSSWPPVSVVIAARNEERGIEPALRSVLALDYPRLQIVVVEDRSTDGTPAILDRMGSEDPRLRIVHIHELPDGWLGKCHALWAGARLASGDRILFTDADVVLERTALSRAMTIMNQDGLDHLAVTPQVAMRGIWLRAFTATFAVLFSLYARPWRASSGRSRCHIGIGAFNLVKRQAYERAGSYEAVRLRPDDDMMLGKIIKKSGHRQSMAEGAPYVSVEWYRSMGEVVRGFEKNAFAGVGYSLLLLAGGTLAQWLLFLWPWAGCALAGGWALGADLASVALLGLMYFHQARTQAISVLTLPLFPLMVLFFSLVVWRSCLKALWHGAIQWRDTAYPLAALKQNRV